MKNYISELVQFQKVYDLTLLLIFPISLPAILKMSF